jgi:transposase
VSNPSFGGNKVSELLGRVSNRLKMLKRQMFARASLGLLQRRFMLAT